jgi:hypothetical protein
MDPVGFLCRLLGEDRATLRFRTWLDTRTLPFPGEPERTCDTVAWLAEADPAVEWAVAVEFSLEPDGEMFGRLLIYLGQLWAEKRPTDAGRERFEVGAVVVNLTGIGRTSRTMKLRETGIETTLKMPDRNLQQQDAAALLEEIAARTTAHCWLPWIPLMHGGGEAGIIQRWLELAGQEPEPERSEYGGLAIVFAEAAGRQAGWKEALKGWNVRDSQQVQEWIDEGVAQGEANAVLEVLAARCPPGAPPELASVVRAMSDLQRLRAWLRLASTTDSLDAFRKAAGL